MDCSFAILDADADIIAQSEKGILLFLSSSSPATKNCIEKHDTHTNNDAEIDVNLKEA